ncbi:Cysteine desulfurase-like protein [Oopsacas minuta]|uniref:Cysteine desulfurase-like protein n=1 Tax=Oopsacas minuta TaxID=111878 RepID=A0AAV7KGX6_9METZ|nr:Cysteine desulfurase-like protein [Oopsacas minuta]
MSFDPKTARGFFPGFSIGPMSEKEGLLMLENAGGTLPPKFVISRMMHQLTHDHVNIGNPSRPSKSAENTLIEARKIMEIILNATPQGRILFGPSCTALIYSMVNVISKQMIKGDEVVLFTATHEANVSPWLHMGETGVKIVEWNLTGDNDYCCITELQKLLTSKTRYVVLPHASNMTGAVSDLSAVIKCVRENSPNARVFVDGVAYAPHKLVDTALLDVDFYVVSTHKMYGPHFACMYAKHTAIDELPRIGLVNLPANSPAHFEYGTLQIEGLAGIIGMKELFNSLEGIPPDSELTRETLKSMFDKITIHELALEKILMTFLNSNPNYMIYSLANSNNRRIPIVCFRHKYVSPKRLSEKINELKIILKSGDFCCTRLLDQMKLKVDDGLVRASFAMYNTVEDAQHLCSILKQIDSVPF